MNAIVDRINRVHGVWIREVKRSRMDEFTGELTHELGWAASHGESIETCSRYYVDRMDEDEAFTEVVTWICRKMGTPVGQVLRG